MQPIDKFKKELLEESQEKVLWKKTGRVSDLTSKEIFEWTRLSYLMGSFWETVERFPDAFLKGLTEGLAWKKGNSWGNFLTFGGIPVWTYRISKWTDTGFPKELLEELYVEFLDEFPMEDFSKELLKEFQKRLLERNLFGDSIKNSK